VNVCIWCWFSCVVFLVFVYYSFNLIRYFVHLREKWTLFEEATRYVILLVNQAYLATLPTLKPY
jgi:hypothetical protein